MTFYSFPNPYTDYKLIFTLDFNDAIKMYLLQTGGYSEGKGFAPQGANSFP